MATNKNENISVQHLWDAPKALPKEKYTAIHAYCKKKNLKQPNLIPKGARKRTKPKRSRRKDIIKIRAEIKDIKQNKTKQNR